MRKFRLTPLLAALALLTSGAGQAVAETDSGSASQYPWSGYWWAHADGGLVPPLQKYDQVNGTKSAAWEQENHVDVEGVQPWFGHCHAWSAASVTEKEPQEARTVKNVQFGIGDQKGLLTAVHASDEATSYGDRFGDGRGSESKADMSPDEIWRLLQLYIRQKNIPLIFDLEAGDEVWNFPVYQYDISYEVGGDGYATGTMQLVVADDDVHPDYQGTQPSIYTYSFRCKMQGGSVVAGTGQWLGESVDDHPDFAWYPYVARAENPDIDPSQVSKIVGYAVGGGSHPGDDEPVVPDNNPPNENPSENPANNGPGPGPGPNGGNSNEPINNDPPPPNDGDGPGPAPPVEINNILGPIELVSLIGNKTSHFSLDFAVDKFDSGKYNVGEEIRVAGRANKPGYLYLFDVGPGGDLKLVFPAPGQQNFVEADKEFVVPRDGTPSWFIAENPGEHHLKGVIVAAPLALTGFHTQGQGKLKAKSKVKPKIDGGKDRYEQGAQKMRVPPTTKARVTKKIRGYYSKSAEYVPPEKLGKAFAQDDCVFYVVGKNGP